MPDVRPMRGPIDPSRVDIHAVQDLSYWSRTLGVSTDRLLLAVAEAGEMANDVRAELRRQRVARGELTHTLKPY